MVARCKEIDLLSEENLQPWWTDALLSCRHTLHGQGAEVASLKQLRVPKEELPPTDAKPVYHTVVVTMAAIDPAQSLFYEACPANNRKACIQMSGSPLGILLFASTSLWVSNSVGEAVSLTAVLSRRHIMAIRMRKAHAHGHLSDNRLHIVQVVQQGEGWYCEFDGRTYTDMLRRYVMQVKCTDGSGEAMLSVFDDQVKL